MTGSFLVLDPDLRIAEVSDAYRRATLLWNEDIRDCRLFDVFPDNPADPGADGAYNLRSSLEHVLATGQPHRMAVQRYDVRDFVAGSAVWVEKHWSPVNRPVCGGDSDEVTHIIHQVQDVTPAVNLLRWADDEARAIAEHLAALAGIQQELRAREEQYCRLRDTIMAILRGEPAGDSFEDIQAQFGAYDELRYYSTANRVPTSGIYEIFHRRECGWSVRERCLVEKQRFPRCTYCRDDVLYRLRQPTSAAP